MGKPIARHEDGSNCYTKHCRRRKDYRGDRLFQETIDDARTKILTSLLPKTGEPRKGLNSAERSPEIETLRQESDVFLQTLPVQDRNLLSQYQHVGFRGVNDYLNGGKDFIKTHYLQRKGQPIDEEEAEHLTAYAVRTIPEIDRVLKNYNTLDANQKTKTYRPLYRAYTLYPEGKKKLTLEDVKNQYRTGAVIKYAGYLSTSADSDYMLVADAESKGQVIVHELVTDKGVPIYRKSSPGSVQHAEKEVLIPRDAKFKIVNVSEETYISSYPEKLPFRVWGNFKRKKKFIVVQMVQV